MKNWVSILSILSIFLVGATIGGGGGVTLKDEGTSQGPISTLDCTGGPVACSVSGATGTIAVSSQDLPAANYYVAGNLFPGVATNTAIPSSTAASGWLASGSCKLS